MIIESQFREAIETALVERGWSRSELARQVGVAPQMVTDYLNARRKPGPDVMERFLKVFGLRLSIVKDEVPVEV